MCFVIQPEVGVRGVFCDKPVVGVRGVFCDTACSWSEECVL